MLNKVIELDDALFQISTELTNQPSMNVEAEMKNLQARKNELAKQQDRLIEVMAKFGASDTVERGLKSIENQKREIEIERARIRSQSVSKDDLPKSADELRNLIRSKFLALADDSYELGHLLPKIVTEVVTYCVRLRSGGPLLPRARFKIDLTGSFTTPVNDDLRAVLVSEFTVDLFDRPKFERHRNKIVKLRQQGMNKKSIRAEVDDDLSLVMVNRALELQESLDAQAAQDPYALQLEPPTDLPKQRRHEHARYRFEALEGHERPDLQ